MPYHSRQIFLRVFLPLCILSLACGMLQPVALLLGQVGGQFGLILRPQLAPVHTQVTLQVTVWVMEGTTHAIQSAGVMHDIYKHSGVFGIKLCECHVQLPTNSSKLLSGIAVVYIPPYLFGVANNGQDNLIFGGYPTGL